MLTLGQIIFHFVILLGQWKCYRLTLVFATLFDIVIDPLDNFRINSSEHNLDNFSIIIYTLGNYGLFAFMMGIYANRFITDI